MANRTPDTCRSARLAPLARWSLCAALAVLSGCQSATVKRPLAQTAVGGNEPEQQMEFLHRLAGEPITSYDDAFHALLLFADGSDPAADYAGRVSAMRSRGLLSNGFNRPANESVDRGTLSVALAKVLKVRGGIVYSIFGPNPRYATKELEYQGVYPASSPNQTFSGSEFLAVLSRAEEYQKANAAVGGGGAGSPPPEMQLKHGGRGPAAEPTPTPAPRPATQPAAL